MTRSPTSLSGDLGVVRLVGRGALPERVEAGGSFPLELFWKCLRPLERDLGVFVHAAGPDSDEGSLRSRATSLARFSADHLPAAGTLPTPLWWPGETIRDVFEAVVPAEIEPGRYTLSAGLWDPKRRSRLRRPGTAGDITVGSFEVVAAKAPRAGRTGARWCG